MRAFLSLDGDECIVAITAREFTLQAHADQLDYKLQLSGTLCAQLLKGDFHPDEFSPPYVAYDLETEERFEKKFSSYVWRRHYDGRNATGSILRSCDRVRVVKACVWSALRHAGPKMFLSSCARAGL